MFKSKYQIAKERIRMQNNRKDYYPGEWDWNSAKESIETPENQKSTRHGMTVGAWICLLCVAVAFSVLSTYVLTTISNQDYYTKLLSEKQQQIEILKTQVGSPQAPETSEGAQQLEALQKLFEQYSYYYGNASDKELMDAVMKAYVQATGDLYADYYTVEEYASLVSDRNGASVGIGISIVQKDLTVDGVNYLGFQVAAIFKNAPAENSGLLIGDFIYRIKVNGDYKTVNELGYTEAANAVRGSKGTVAEISAFRVNESGYSSHDFSILRDTYEKESVSYRLSETDNKVGIVHIAEFDLTTPRQFKSAVTQLISLGAEHFVFDVRNNPGGDLQSIKAVLTYFLQPGDIILSSITRDEKIASTYVAEVINWSGEYSACNVSAPEIGMFASLDKVVLCNENTASAAEVFTATMRDYNLAKIVGRKTFGKGIMQTTLTITKSGKPIGYVKLTTHAYVTKCGITYHEIGISPDPEYNVELSEEAKKYNFYILPEEIDNQLQTAIQAVKS